MSDEKTPLIVLFRRYPMGDVIALFPEEPGDPVGAYAMCASGHPKIRHYPADVMSVLVATAPATETQAKRLKTGLEKEFGYVLDVKESLTAGETIDMSEKRSEKRGEYARYEKLRHLY